MEYLAGLAHDDFLDAEPIALDEIARSEGRKFADLPYRNEETLEIDWLWPPSGFKPARHRIAGNMKICAISEARVFGPSLIVSSAGLLTSPEIFPEYLKNYANQGDLGSFCKESVPPVIDADAINIDIAFAPLHFTRNTYGHFLLEMVSKLMVIQDLVAQGLDFPVILVSHSWPFVRQIAELVAPDLRFVYYDFRKNWLRVKQLLVPSRTEESDVFHYKGVADRFRDLADRFSLETTIPKHRRLFIYRTKKTSFRFLSNWEELLEIARRFGFTAVDPAELPWKEQVALFAGADQVVGELTSAFHNTIFCRDGSNTVALNRIGRWQDGIAASRRHRLGYIPPDDGKMREYSVGFTDRQDFVISPKEFEGRLGDLYSGGRP